MAFRGLHAADAFWRPSNQMGVPNTDLAKQLSALLVEPESLRQVFNDTEADALWLVVGSPAEAANTRELTAEQLAQLYPDGPQALPPELAS
jgi:hypothetical protein